MAVGWTNRGKKLILEWVFNNADAGVTIPTYFYVALVRVTNVPGPTTNVFSDLVEITAGNGYTTGGYQLELKAADFDGLNEDDTNHRGEIQIKDVVWTASGGAIPDSGLGARYAVLLDYHATVGSRQVIAYWDLTSARSVSDGQSLTLQDCELRLTES